MIEALLDTVEWSEIKDGSPVDAGDGLPYATHQGVLWIGDRSLRCYRLSDGRAVFDADDVHEFFCPTPEAASE
jgi:hypothetical protein